MKLVTHIVAADEDELTEVAETASPLKIWSGVEAPGLDTVKLAALHALLTGDSLQTALDLYEPALVTGAGEDVIVLRVSGELLEELALLDEESLETVASELAATEVYEKENADPDELRDCLTALAELAQLAESQEQTLWVRIGMLLE
ncbi:MAG: hypothetical protein LBU43_09690 [Candidatus Accumulibacter sp.]|jgi:hypothetical protein|nr:hypothetical protein [Accumulibacter sp.]